MVIAPDGGEPMTLVLTGQPDVRKKDSGKYLEFVFRSTTKKQKVDSAIINKFSNAYLSYNQKDHSSDYEWRTTQLQAGKRIPVFFLRDHTGITDIGLSYLFKLAYTQSIEQALITAQGEAKPDTADAIFGSIGDTGFLKGRVQITHAKAPSDTPEPYEVKKVILGEPKASFYPTYLDQTVAGSQAIKRVPSTLMDKRPEIAGRKRYPLLSNGTTRPTRDRDENNNPLSDKVFTKFKPLPAGTTFTCQLHYHNLHPIELGALLSALSFHGNDKCRHQIGMAKPLGYGQVSLGIAYPDDTAQLLDQFEAFMDASLGNKKPTWYRSPQLCELVAMSTPVDRSRIPVLAGDYPYNKLSEFKNIKQYKREWEDPIIIIN